MDLREHYFPHQMYIKLGGLTAYDIDIMEQKYECARGTDSGIPIFGMLSAINQERRKVLDSMGLSASQDLTGSKLEYELKQENILAKRILNQAKLGVLIPKDEASERVKRTLRAVMNTIKTGIKRAAVKLVNIGNQRDIEAVLTNEWNRAIDDLKKSSEIISWEQDGSSQLLMTRITDIAKEDPEFGDALGVSQLNRVTEDEDAC